MAKSKKPKAKKAKPKPKLVKAKVKAAKKAAKVKAKGKKAKAKKPRKPREPVFRQSDPSLPYVLEHHKVKAEEFRPEKEYEGVPLPKLPGSFPMYLFLRQINHERDQIVSGIKVLKKAAGKKKKEALEDLERKLKYFERHLASLPELWDFDVEAESMFSDAKMGEHESPKEYFAKTLAALRHQLEQARGKSK